MEKQDINKEGLKKHRNTELLTNKEIKMRLNILDFRNSYFGNKEIYKQHIISISIGLVSIKVCGKKAFVYPKKIVLLHSFS